VFVEELYSCFMADSEARPLLRIGDLSRRLGVSDHVLRAWESRYGLLRPRRSPGGFRLYSEADESRVRRMQAYITEGCPRPRRHALPRCALVGHAAVAPYRPHHARLRRDHRRHPQPALVLAGTATSFLFGIQRHTSGGILAPALSHLTWSILMLTCLPVARSAKAASAAG
jgi:MerR family regulatory protein